MVYTFKHLKAECVWTVFDRFWRELFVFGHY